MKLAQAGPAKDHPTTNDEPERQPLVDINPRKMRVHASTSYSTPPLAIRVDCQKRSEWNWTAQMRGGRQGGEGRRHSAGDPRYHK